MHPELRSSLTMVGLVANALAPRIRSRLLTIPSFSAGWLVTEGAGPILAVRGARFLGRAKRGEYREPGGLLRAGAELVALGAVGKLIVDALRVDEEFEAVLCPVLGEEFVANRPRSVRLGALIPLLQGTRKSSVVRTVKYHEEGGWRNTLDIYESKVESPNGPGQLRPCVVEIHGGGWVIGNKTQQGIPLLNHMVGLGWVGININYRLAPRSKLPAQVIDCKRAIAWIREHADSLGIDPDMIVVTGGSAGGHLSSLTALTANDPQFQPGFEDKDTSVAGAVPFYGVYDLLDTERAMVPGFLEYIEDYVLGAKIKDSKELLTSVSPRFRVHPDAPPMMMIHGTVDTLAPVEQGRAFARILADVSEHTVLFVECAGANHAFDVFPSVRSVRTIEFVERFLEAVRIGLIK